MANTLWISGDLFLPQQYKNFMIKIVDGQPKTKSPLKNWHSKLMGKNLTTNEKSMVTNKLKEYEEKFGGKAHYGLMLSVHARNNL